MRRYVAIFAVVALSLLVLRPVCDALALSGAQGVSATLAHSDARPGGTHWSSLATVANATQDLFAAPAFLIALVSLAALALSTRSAAPNAAPLPTRTYYARSARILR